MCLQTIRSIKAKFPVISLSGKGKNHIPRFLCAVATQFRLKQEWIQEWAFSVGGADPPGERDAKIQFCQIPRKICIKLIKFWSAKAKSNEISNFNNISYSGVTQ